MSADELEELQEKGDYIMIKEEYILEAYGNIYRITLEESCYWDGNYAIIMRDYNKEYNCWENWDSLTTNLPRAKHKDIEKCAYVQSDKYLNFVLRNKLGTPTGNEFKSGYNHYTEIQFDI